MFAAAIDAFGRVDAVLNVAGIGTAAPLAEVTMEAYDRTMDVDPRGVFLGTPLAAHLDDDTLRAQLLRLARRFLTLPD